VGQGVHAQPLVQGPQLGHRVAVGLGGDQAERGGCVGYSPPPITRVIASASPSVSYRGLGFALLASRGDIFQRLGSHGFGGWG